MTSAAERRPVVVGIGEVLWDVYPDGAHLGGAPANFACHAAALGAEAWIISAVGADELGDRAVEQLRAQGPRVDHIARDREHATGRVNVTLDAEQRPTFEIATDAAWDHIPWSDGLEQLAARADAQSLFDYISFDGVDYVRWAEEPGRPILYGTTKRFLELFGLNTLKDLPHVGGVYGRLDTVGVRRTIGEVTSLLAARETRFGELGIDSMASYRRIREISETYSDPSLKAIPLGDVRPLAIV